MEHGNIKIPESIEEKKKLFQDYVGRDLILRIYTRDTIPGFTRVKIRRFEQDLLICEWVDVPSFRGDYVIDLRKIRGVEEELAP